jgi:integrase
MPRRLTEKFISTLKPPTSGRTEVVDSESRGLVFRLGTNGRASWTLRYTNARTRKQERHTLGDYPALSLAKAREKAITFRASLLDGADPRAKTLDTVTDLLDEYHRRYVLPNTRKPEQTRALYDTHIVPSLGSMRLMDLRRGDVVDMLDRLQDRGLKAQTNRVQSALSAALNWGVDAGHLPINPILGLKHRFKESPRDRVLTDDELKAVWHAAAARTAPSREFVQLLILTMQRRDEVRGMRWDELDETTRAWTIPASRNKANRAHIVPLPPRAWDLIDKLPRLGPFVFTIDGERPLRRTCQARASPPRRVSRPGMDAARSPPHRAHWPFSAWRPTARGGARVEPCTRGSGTSLRPARLHRRKGGGAAEVGRTRRAHRHRPCRWERSGVAITSWWGLAQPGEMREPCPPAPTSRTRAPCGGAGNAAQKGRSI